MIDSEQNVMNNQILCFLLLLKLNRFNSLNLTKFQIRENGEGLLEGVFCSLIDNSGEKKGRFNSHFRNLKCVADNAPVIYSH